jgi:predicted alpha/beta hydrolase
MGRASAILGSPKSADGSIDRALIQTLLARFAAIQARTLAISFTDDPFATDVATERLLTLFANAPSSRLILSADDGDGQKIGHFGFFSPRFRMTLWPECYSCCFGSGDIN